MASNGCPSDADHYFGPRVTPECRSFDFTLVFEQSFFSIGPAALFLLFSPLRLYHLSGKPILVRGGLLHRAKLVLITAYVLANLALLIVMSTAPIPRSITTVLATTLDLAVAICMLPLSHFEHLRTLRPSGLLSAFLFFTVILSIVRTRTYWLMPNEWSSYAACYTATFVLKLLVLISESWDKTWLLPIQDQRRSPEERAGVLKRSVFAWLNSLFLKGYRKGLNFEDLYPVDVALGSRLLADRLQRVWKKRNHGGKYDLATSLFRCMLGSLLIPVIPRLFLIGFKFSQPFLVERVTAYLTEPEGENDAAIGYSLIGAYGLVYIGLAISKGCYWHFQYRFITMVRGALVTVIYRKTLAVDAALVSGSQATTLMSADIEQIAVGFQWIHEIWANSVEVAVGLWLLQQQVGFSALVTAAVALICAVLASYVAGVAASRQKVWLGAMERRLHETTRFLQSSKSIKMLGLEVKVLGTIGRLREIELGRAMYWWVMTCIALALGFIPQLLGPPVVFGIFVFTHEKSDTVLDTSRLFSSIAILALVTTPLNFLFQSLPTVGAAFNCLSRIQTFLRLDDVRDFRKAITFDRQGEAPVSGTASKHEALPAFVVSGGAFAWKAGASPVLENINCSIPNDKLTIIIGPVASGKSTLLQALLGEVVQVRGEVKHSSSRVAFCSQNPWLTNSTIRSTIIGTSEEDEDWYNTVLKACDLAEDVDRMPDGDKTVVGSAGTALSGGQKQRLTLARAIYSRASVLLLDDILSGLDRRTEDHILTSLFGLQGLLRHTFKCTVVLVTHAERHLKLGDHIIALGAAGKGSREGPASQFIGHLDIPLTDDSDEDKTPQPKLDFMSILVSQPAPPTPESTEEHQGTGALSTSTILSDRRVFLYYIRAVSLRHFVLLTIEVMFAGFLERFPTYWAELWGEANEESPKLTNNNYYWGIYTLLQLLALAQLFGAVWHLFMYIIPRSATRLHSRLLAAVLRASQSFLSQTDVGTITNRFSQDLLLIDTQLPISLLNFGAYLATAITGFALIASASVVILATAPILLVVLYLIQRFYLRTSKSMRLFDLQAKAPLYSQFTDALNGLATIRAFGWMTELRVENELLLDTSQRPFYLMYCIQRWLTCVLDLVVAGLAVTVMGIAVAYRQKANAAAVGVALVNIISLGSTIESVVTEYTQLETSIGAVARIQEFVETTPQETSSSDDDEYHEEAKPDSHAAVELMNVTATYGKKKVLNKICMQIRSGEKVAICGRSGSGKSTLLQVLLRMLDVAEGELVVFGKNVTQAPSRIHRETFNTIPQESYFFPGTFRDNLILDKEIAEDQLLDVLFRVGLKQKILDLGGLDEDFSPATFSSGESQLLSLARAILHPKPILLLDEATSNVDAETDVKMHNIIWEEFQSSTIIAVLHRQEPLHRFDRVIVLDQGKIASDARPSELKLTA